MNSLVDEVRQIEGKVIEISRLQEVFADKVLQQVGMQHCVDVDWCEGCCTVSLYLYADSFSSMQPCNIHCVPALH